MGILKRLFIKTPLTIVFILSCFTVIIPFIYWVVTGEDYVELKNKIEEI